VSGTSVLNAVLRDVGRRVAELRRALDLTQEAAAERLGMHPANYARIEQGRQNVTVETLVRVASVCKVSVAELFVVPESSDPAEEGPQPKAKRRARGRAHSRRQA
jgi:transcriptional regulator with XRE-family HTH domain